PDHLSLRFERRAVHRRRIRAPAARHWTTSEGGAKGVHTGHFACSTRAHRSHHAIDDCYRECARACSWEPCSPTFWRNFTQPPPPAVRTVLGGCAGRTWMDDRARPRPCCEDILERGFWGRAHFPGRLPVWPVFCRCGCNTLFSAR